jgi:hypothetical protein
VFHLRVGKFWLRARAAEPGFALSLFAFHQYNPVRRNA